MERGYYSYILPSGEKIEMQFSSRVLRKFCEAKGWPNVEDIKDKIAEWKTKESVSMMLLAIQNLCHEKKTDCKYDEETIWDLVDEAGGVGSPLLVDVFYMTMATYAALPLDQMKKVMEDAMKMSEEAAKNGEHAPLEKVQEAVEEQKKSGRVGTRYIRKPQPQA